MIFWGKKKNSGTEITFTFMHLAEAKQLALHLRYTVSKFIHSCIITRTNLMLLALITNDTLQPLKKLEEIM